MQSIFELASRHQIRFSSNRGELSTEQLWTMPLTAKSGFDLDSVAKAVNTQLRAMAEESFVDASDNPAKTELELKLEVVKHIIAVRKQENADALARAGKAQERARLVEILGHKQDQALQGLSEEELKARIAELG